LYNDVMKLAVMGGITEIVDSLEGKLLKLTHKLEGLQKANRQAENEVLQSASLVSRQQEEIILLKKQNESLRMANSLLGSDDNKRETKLKINSLIRDIDHCIAQLSD
jgi:hypothetical protein